MRKRTPRASWSALFVLLSAGCRPAPREGARRAEIKGELTRIGGVRVLRLWGSPREQGYAHGFLLAREIRDVFDGFVAVALLRKGSGAYERAARELKRAAVPEACAEEIRGLVEGMRAALGEDARSKALGRPIDYELALVANSLPDWACSSFAAWGERTRGGTLIAARNLDYPVPPVVISTQLVVVREGRAPRAGWFSVGTPGLVGATTAINERRQVFFMHDSNGLDRVADEGFMPRTFALRKLAEELPGPMALVRAREMLSLIPTWRGNNFLISGCPELPGPFAGVIEYDGGLRGRDGHATLRMGTETFGPGAECVCCTNHYRLRASPEECARYGKIVAALERASGIGPEEAKEAIAAAGVSITIHTLVFDAGSSTLLLSMGRTVGVGAHRGPFARIGLDELFGRGGSAARSD